MEFREGLPGTRHERAAELVGKSFAHSKTMIQAAEISKKLPESSTVDCTTLNATHMTELGRLAPDAKGGQGLPGDFHERPFTQTGAHEMSQEPRVQADQGGTFLPLPSSTSALRSLATI